MGRNQATIPRSGAFRVTGHSPATGLAPTLNSNPAMALSPGRRRDTVLNPLPVRTMPPSRGPSRATVPSPVWVPVEGCLLILQVRWEGRR